MKYDEIQKFKLVAESAEESLMMQGYDIGFQNGYMQAVYDGMSDEEKEHFDKARDGLRSMFDLIKENE